jgi:hypothetical protein
LGQVMAAVLSPEIKALTIKLELSDTIVMDYFRNGFVFFQTLMHGRH